MAKLTLYKVNNYGRFRDDSEDSSGERFFEKLSDAKAFAFMILEDYGDDSESFEVSRVIVDTGSDTRMAIVDALNGELGYHSTLIGRVQGQWFTQKPKKGEVAP